MTKINIRQLTARALTAMLISTAAATPALAKSTVNLKGRESSGFNALDHVLQQPLGNPSFPEDERGFGNHIFLGLGGGVSLIGNNFNTDIKAGYHLNGQLGGWITPVHGIRITGEYGRNSVHNNVPNTTFYGIGADYLLNFSSLLRGYDPHRRFELIGTAGVIARRITQENNSLNGYNVGVSTSLQMRFNVAPSLYLYMEPRVAMISGTRFDRPYNYYRMHADVAFNVGLGYRILTGRYRREGATDFRQSNDDNLFFGAGAGLFGFTSGDSQFKNPIGHAFFGKMFSSASGLQLGLNFGQYRPNDGFRNRFLAIGSLDYVLNLNSAFGGYRPDETFQLLLNTGVSAATVTRGTTSKVTPGVDVGLTALFRLSPNWGIYVHPQLYAFKSTLGEALRHDNSPLASVELGLRYTIGDFTRLHPGSYEEYAGAKHWFLEGGFGGSARMRKGFGAGGDAYVGFGKRFTPVSSWRINFEGALFPKDPHTVTATIHADYLSSLTTAMMGYDPDRLFDLQLVAGVYAGAANYLSPITYTYGLKGGLQANFRLNSALDLYVEPQILAARCPAHGTTHIWTPEGRVQIGLRYKLGTPAGERGYLDETPYGERPNFISIASGPSAFNGKFYKKEPAITPLLDIAVGRWFSMVSGFRLSFNNDWIKTSYSKRYYVASGHIDYLLNFTSLFDRSANRRFHIIGAIGGGIAGSNGDNTKVGGMGYGGVQFRYNLPSNVDIHLEPGVQVWKNCVIPNALSVHRFSMATRISAGASYRFVIQ